ncbi:MAG: N-glycosylase/DNA lyase [Candidatus Diapherotrites archaeon]|nr:N-glycosylase/DNA lyase [Candidatus Diapherotrites archaeon]
MEIAETIKAIGVEGARWVEEHLDEQYKALSFLAPHLSGEDFLKLMVIHALLSYQLSSTGEEWWWEFARHFSRKSLKTVCEYRNFLISSRGGRRLLPQKLRRLERICGWIENVELLPYYTRMLDLRNEIARVLGTSSSSKTVVFAVKMFGYGGRILTGRFVPYPMEVPIPVDLRIERLTRRLGDDDPIRFWNEVARASSVPPLHIDSILWPLLGNEELREPFLRRFGEPGRRLLALI